MCSSSQEETTGGGRVTGRCREGSGDLLPRKCQEPVEVMRQENKNKIMRILWFKGMRKLTFSSTLVKTVCCSQLSCERLHGRRQIKASKSKNFLGANPMGSGSSQCTGCCGCTGETLDPLLRGTLQGFLLVLVFALVSAQ